MAVSLHTVLILLSPDQASMAVQSLNDWPAIVTCTATLGIDAPIDLPSEPPWLTVISSGALAALCQDEGLPQEATEHFYIALLRGAGVLHVKGYLTDEEPDRLVQVLEHFCRSSVREDYFPGWTELHLILDIAHTRDADEPITGHGSTVESVQYSPDGCYILTTSMDETAKVWDAASGREVLTLRGRHGPNGGSSLLCNTCYSPDSRAILAWDGGQLRLWDVQTGQERWRRSTWIPLAFSPDGTSIAIYNGTVEWGIIKVIDLQTGEERLRLAGEEFVYSPDGKSIFTLSREGDTVIAVVQDIQTGQPYLNLRLALPHSVVDLTYGTDGRTVATVDRTHDLISVWAIKSGRRCLETAGWRARYSPDGKKFVTFFRSDTATVWDTQTWQALLQIADTSDMIFSPDGETFTTFPGESRLSVTHVQVRDSHTGKELLVFTDDGQVSNNEVISNPLVGSLKCGGPVYLRDYVHPEIMYSSDGSRILLTCRGNEQEHQDEGGYGVIHGTTLVWDIRGKKLLFVLVGIHATYSPDGQQLLTVLDDGRVAVWEATSGHFIRMLGQMRVLLRVRCWGRGGVGGPGIEEQPKAPVIERFADVHYPEKVRSQQRFTMQVGLVCQTPDEELEDARPASVMVTIDAEGKRTGAKPVEVTLNAPGFLLTANHGELEVYADKDTPPISFQLKPNPGALGLQPVHVMFCQRGECLGEVVAVINVAATTFFPSLVGDLKLNKARYESKRMTLREPPGQKWGNVVPPDVVLYVTHQRLQGGDRLSYQFEWVKEYWPRLDGGSVDLDSSVEEKVAAYYAQLSTFTRPRTAAQTRGTAAAQRELERIGENLYLELFTPQLKQFYKQFAPTARSLLVYSNEPWIPWEVIKPWGEDLDEQWSDFLCARLPFSRWYFNDEGQRVWPTLNLHLLNAIVPPSNLPYVGEEAVYLEGLQGRWPGLLVEVYPMCNGEQLLWLMEQGTVNLFHLATHGILRPTASSTAEIALGRDTLLASELVGTKIAKGLARSAPLVFMNACHSSRQSQGLTKLEGWADRFVMFGCSGFIGANWKVHDRLASHFAINFYESLRARKTVAESLQDARLAVRALDPANSTWLAYSLYAHPNLRIHTQQQSL